MAIETSVGEPKPKTESLKTKAIQELLHGGLKSISQQAFEQTAPGFDSIQEIEVSSGDTTIDLQKTLDDDRLLPRIWRQIRAFAAYRPEHIRERIEGPVHVRIRIGRGGELLHIFEESLTGPQELQGWVLLFLIEALKTPFLSEKLSAHRILDLRFYFSINQTSPSSQKNSARMIFPIDGSLPLHVKMAQNAHDLFADAKLKNAPEWSFYERLKIYQKACDNKNPVGCEKVNEMKRWTAKK